MRVSPSAWRLALCAAAVWLATTATANAADPVRVTPGNWEIATSIEMPNRPPLPPVTMTHCTKPGDIANGQTFADRMQMRSGKCTFSDFKMDGDKMSYGFTCESGGSGTSQVVFAGTSYEATTKTSVRADRSAKTTISHVKARRVGDC